MTETNAETITNYDPSIRIKYDGPIIIATGLNKTSKQWKNKSLLWSEFVEKLSYTTRTPETYAEYKKMPKTDRDRIKDVGGFVGGSLKNGRRKAENVANRTLLTLDLDYVNGDVWSSIELLWDFSVAMYSTHTHASDNQRLRIVIPLSRPVLPDEYQAIARMIADDIGIDQFDDTTYEPSRLMYNPSTSYDGDYIFKVQDLPWLNPDEILERYTFGWQDISYYPESSRARAKLNSAIKKQEDPLEKKGVIGAFCRTYSISEAIAEFLNEVYTAGADDTRYTYTDGSTSGGLVVYEDKFSFSHHGTDPTSGILCNAFDLIRIHKFGELDDNAKEDTPSKQLRSFKAMTEFAANDEKTKLNIIMDDFIDEEKAKESIKYMYTTETGNLKVNTGLLAKHIRDTSDYMIVRKQGYDTDLLYWYKDGVYQRISANELKGNIKTFIPERIRTPSQWENTYKDLITETDTKCIEFEKLNTDEEYINVKDGLFNIKTKKLEPHNSEIKSTLQMNCNYKEDAPEPKIWLDFIHSLCNYDKSIEKVLQEWTGLFISNIDISVVKQCLILFSYEGNTGKSQYLNTLGRLLGKNNTAATPLHKLSDRFGTGDLYGKRLNIVDEQSEVTIEDSSIFKALTGGGDIPIELKGKQQFPYHYRGGLVIGCNGLPYIKDDKGNHIFQRISLIECTNVIPPEKRIPGLADKMYEEIDGIFLWGLDGLYRLISNNYKFTNSKAINDVKEKYRKDKDSVYRYLKENYIITNDKKDQINKVEFENGYYDYKAQTDEDSSIFRVKKKNIQDRLKKYGIDMVKNNTYVYRGLKKNEKNIH